MSKTHLGTAYLLVKKLNVDAPITMLVHACLFENKPVKKALYELVSRDPKPEWEMDTVAPTTGTISKA
jgi:glycerol-3-phosphate dehydrogenase